MATFRGVTPVLAVMRTNNAHVLKMRSVRAGGGGPFTRSAHQCGVTVNPLKYLASVSQNCDVHPLLVTGMCAEPSKNVGRIREVGHIVILRIS
jgi:hypothetical protein